MSPTEKHEYIDQYIAAASSSAEIVEFDAIPNIGTTNLDETFDYFKTLLYDKGFTRICRVRYTERDASLQVVKIIIPKLEFFDPATQRVGIRLKNYVETLE